MDRWNVVSVRAPRTVEEPVSALLVAAGSVGVSVNELVRSTDDESLSPVANDEVEIAGYFPESTPLDGLMMDIVRRLDWLCMTLDFSVASVSTKSVGAEDWVENWKQYYAPIRITNDITIVPSWTEEYLATDNQKIIRLDPGSVFGTGSHPTTILAIFALHQVLRGGETVLDVGTGSGVLAIVSVALGAAQVFAFDNYDSAVENAIENAARNGYQDRITVTENDLLAGVRVDGDVIVANILAEVLTQMIDDAVRLLKINGHLVLSGIYFDKVEQIIAQVTQTGLILLTRMSQGDWHCLVFVKSI